MQAGLSSLPTALLTTQDTDLPPTQALTRVDSVTSSQDFLNGGASMAGQVHHPHP